MNSHLRNLRIVGSKRCVRGNPEARQAERAELARVSRIDGKSQQPEGAAGSIPQHEDSQNSSRESPQYLATTGAGGPKRSNLYAKPTEAVLVLRWVLKEIASTLATTPLNNVEEKLP